MAVRPFVVEGEIVVEVRDEELEKFERWAKERGLAIEGITYFEEEGLHLIEVYPKEKTFLRKLERFAMGGSDVIEEI